MTAGVGQLLETFSGGQACTALGRPLTHVSSQAPVYRGPERGLGTSSYHWPDFRGSLQWKLAGSSMSPPGWARRRIDRAAVTIDRLTVTIDIQGATCNCVTRSIDRTAITDDIRTVTCNCVRRRIDRKAVTIDIRTVTCNCGTRSIDRLTGTVDILGVTCNCGRRSIDRGAGTRPPPRSALSARPEQLTAQLRPRRSSHLSGPAPKCAAACPSQALICVHPCPSVVLLHAGQAAVFICVHPCPSVAILRPYLNLAFICVDPCASVAIHPFHA